MTLLEAIESRHSVRSYTGKPLDGATIAALQQQIDRCNANGRLHIQLVTNEPQAFSCRMARYGKFSGVTNYIVMAGQRSEDLDERVGYYGEHLVLEAQMMGLNTCWVGLTYSKIPGAFNLAEGEKVVAVISIGYGSTAGTTHKIKKAGDVSNVTADSPEWFVNGVKAALLAPTAVNQQKFRFTLEPSGKVTATVRFSLVGYTHVDLGIVKYHFEAASGHKISNYSL